MYITYGMGVLFAILFSFCLTPLVKRFAERIGAVDKPNERKVHTGSMPRMGGLAIYVSFCLTYAGMVYWTDAVSTNVGYALVFGGAVVVFVGMLDDRFELKPLSKIAGQLVAALVAMYFGLQVEVITVPFWDETIELGWLGIPITLLWIVGVTNAINLIDGLDGLAAGVSAIGFFALSVVSFMMGNMMMGLTALLLIGAIIGFLFHNFYPARIFMGDTGALFLGFSLSVMSLLELKQATLISFVVPILILGIPIMDTLYAIIRRKLNRQSISTADKNHLHHRLLTFGLSHRNTVLVIYAISLLFSFVAIFLSQSPLWITVLVVLALLFIIEMLAEYLGLLNSNHRPILSFIQTCIRLFSSKDPK